MVVRRKEVLDMMHKQVLAQFGLSLLLANGAAAQENWSALSTSDPNLYVREVQTALSEAGFYAGASTGQLDRATISAINEACAAADLTAACQVGPLAPSGAAAVEQAVLQIASRRSEPISAVGAVRDDDAEPQTVTWRASSANSGMLISVSTNSSVAAATITGVVDGQGWANISTDQKFAAGAGEDWSFEFTSSASLLEGGEARARIAAFDGDEYLGELNDGAVISGGAPQGYVVAGTTPEGTTAIAPYIQLRYGPGAKLDDSVLIMDAVVKPSP